MNVFQEVYKKKENETREYELSFAFYRMKKYLFFQEIH